MSKFQATAIKALQIFRDKYGNFRLLLRRDKINEPFLILYDVGGKERKQKQLDRVHLWGRNFHLYQKYAASFEEDFNFKDRFPEDYYRKIPKELLRDALGDLKTSVAKIVKNKIKKLYNELEKQELAIPIHGIRTNDLLDFGEVKILPPDEIDWESFNSSFNNKRKREKLLEFYEKEGLTATVLVSVKVHRKVAFLRAYSKLEKILALLTFFNVEIGKGAQVRGKVYIDIEGKAQLGFCSWYTRRFDGTSKGGGSKSVGLDYLSDLVVDSKKFQRFVKSKIGKRIIKIFQKQRKREIDKRIIKSLVWYRQAMSQIELYQRFGFLFIAFEVLLYPSEKELTIVECNGNECKKRLQDLPKQTSKFNQRVKSLTKEGSDLILKYAVAKLTASSQKEGSLKKIRNYIFHSGLTDVSYSDVAHLKIAYEATFRAAVLRGYTEKPTSTHRLTKGKKKVRSLD